VISLEFLFMQECRMARRLLGLAPLLDHGRSYGMQFFQNARASDVGGQFQAVAVRVKEADRLEDVVIGWAKPGVFASLPMGGECGTSKNASTFPWPASRKMCI
jgi:hypothetical protein